MNEEIKNNEPNNIIEEKKDNEIIPFIQPNYTEYEGNIDIDMNDKIPYYLGKRKDNDNEETKENIKRSKGMIDFLDYPFILNNNEINISQKYNNGIKKQKIEELNLIQEIKNKIEYELNEIEIEKEKSGKIENDLQIYKNNLLIDLNEINNEEKEIINNIDNMDIDINNEIENNLMDIDELEDREIVIFEQLNNQIIIYDENIHQELMDIDNKKKLKYDQIQELIEEENHNKKKYRLI